MLDDADKKVSGTLRGTDRIIEPLRRSAFRRFPTLFLLLAAFGVSAIVFAFERLIMEWKYLYERPWLILIVGVAVLVATGRLYKKLG